MNHPQTLPPREEIAGMPPFEGISPERIHLVTGRAQAALAMEELMAASCVGFDTESKPTFRKGEASTGPHVVQFSTLEKAFIFQSRVKDSHEAILELLRSDALTKIGFGLGGDLRQISGRFGIRPAAIVDLDASFRKLGYHHSLGAKSAVALLFQRRLLKSKSVTTSNWSARELTERQLRYAANDAYAALRIFHALREGGIC